MATLVTYIADGGLLLIAGIVVVILWQILIGRIPLNGLMDGDFWNGREWTTGFSAARVQLLMITIFAAGDYLLQVVANPTRLPVLPDGLLKLLMGSSTLYLGSKAWGFRGSPPQDR